MKILQQEQNFSAFILESSNTGGTDSHNYNNSSSNLSNNNVNSNSSRRPSSASAGPPRTRPPPASARADEYQTIRKMMIRMMMRMGNLRTRNICILTIHQIHGPQVWHNELRISCFHLDPPAGVFVQVVFSTEFPPFYILIAGNATRAPTKVETYL